MKQLLIVKDEDATVAIVAHRAKLLDLHERSTTAAKTLVIFQSVTALLCMTSSDIVSQDIVNPTDLNKCLRAAIEVAAAPMMLSTEQTLCYLDCLLRLMTCSMQLFMSPLGVDLVANMLI